MAKMPWLKLYTEIRTDPKMQSLSDLEFRTWINIMCLSAESKVRGVICIDIGLAYPIEGIARALSISTDELTSCLNVFKKLRMIDVDQDGIITLINFDARQYDKPSDSPEEVKKRVTKHRAKKNNANVTPLKREENAIEEDREKEGDVDKELVINNDNNNAREGENVTKPIETDSLDLTADLDILPDDRSMAIGTIAVNWAEKNWGRMIPKGESDSILAWCDDFASRGSPEPDAVVIEGLRCCLKADVRKMNYLDRALTDWSEAGLLTVDQVLARDAEHRSKSQKDHKRNKDPANMPINLVPKKDPNRYDNFYL